MFYLAVTFQTKLYRFQQRQILDVPFSKRLSLFNRWSINRKSNKKSIFQGILSEDRFGGVEERNKEL